MNAHKFHGLLDFPGASPRLRNLAGAFAREAHSTWPDLADVYPLPAALRQRAAETGLTGIGIAEAYGGQGGGYADICACAAEAGFWSQAPGLGFFLLIHQLIAKFSLGSLASAEQKAEYLPQLAAGGMIAAQAISEADGGGSPKRMKTRAEKNGGGWVLTGDKSFVTNGPLAGLFITLAVTGERDGKRAFSAFLVPASAEGVQVLDIGPLSFLRPAPHGAVRFDGVRLSERNLLGEEGQALDFLARRFAALEDLLMAGLLAGGFAALFRCLCRDAAQAGQNRPEKQKAAGRLQAGLTALAGFAAHGAAKAPDFLQKSQGITARELVLCNLSLLRKLAHGLPPARDSARLFTDLEKSLGIRGKLADRREEQAGKEFLPDQP
jgi:acyl-CoA dehydrogenase